MKSVIITGANSGLGKEVARQLAQLPDTKRIILACRNEERAKAAQKSLEETTGKSIFEIILMDVSKLDSVKAAVASIKEPVDGLVMNAGGMGGVQFSEKTVDGVTQMVAVNVLGHVVLLDELLKAKKLTKVAMYSGSEASRGISKMGMKRPSLKNSSVEEFKSICDGSFYGNKRRQMIEYGPTKFLATLWMSSLSRQYPDIRFVTMSPGGSSGTDVYNDLPPVMKFMFNHIGLRLLPLFGLMHKLENGAERYVNALTDETYKSGKFYASKEHVLTGSVVDQSTIFNDFNNETFQDNANEAIHSFIN